MSSSSASSASSASSSPEAATSTKTLRARTRGATKSRREIAELTSKSASMKRKSSVKKPRKRLRREALEKADQDEEEQLISKRLRRNRRDAQAEEKAFEDTQHRGRSRRIQVHATRSSKAGRGGKYASNEDDEDSEEVDIDAYSSQPDADEDDAYEEEDDENDGSGDDQEEEGDDGDSDSAEETQDKRPVHSRPTRRSARHQEPPASTSGGAKTRSGTAAVFQTTSRPTRHATIAVDYVDAEEPLSVYLPSSTVKPDLKRILHRMDLDAEATSAQLAQERSIGAAAATVAAGGGGTTISSNNIPPTSTSLPQSSTNGAPNLTVETREALSKTAEDKRLNNELKLSDISGIDSDDNGVRSGEEEANLEKQHYLVQRSSHLDLEYDADSDDEEFVKTLVDGTNAITLDEFEVMIEVAEQEEFMANLFSWTNDELAQKDGLESSLQKLRQVASHNRGENPSSSMSPCEKAAAEESSTEDTDNTSEVVSQAKVLTSIERLQLRLRSCSGPPDVGSSVLNERVGALFPFNCARRLSAACCKQEVLEKFMPYWLKKRERYGPLLRRFQKSDLLVNWSITDVYADEDDLRGGDCMTRRSALSMLYTLRAMHDDFIQLETLTSNITRRERLKLQLLQSNLT